MNQQKTIPLGVEDFRSVVSDCYYVDKTAFIEDVMEKTAPTAPLLYIRPRRFGKSLALSMLDYYLDLRKGDYSLFQGLAISRNEAVKKAHFAQYPCVHLNFKRIKGENYEEFLYAFSLCVRDAYQSLIDDSMLAAMGETDRAYVEKVLSLSCDARELKDSLLRLTAVLSRHYGKGCIILIDEYDSPILEAEEFGYYEEARLFAKSFLGDALKGNPHLRKAILTGVLALANASILSDLNNLVINSPLSNDAVDHFGFTEEEVRGLCAYFGAPYDAEKLREWYGGYRFQNSVVHNPWSILSYVHNRGLLDVYWVYTGTYRPLKKFLSAPSAIDGYADLKSLLNGGDVIAKVNAHYDPASRKERDGLLSMLLLTGYLTFERTLDPLRFRLHIPNREIGEVYCQEVLSRYASNESLLRLESLKSAFSLGASKEVEEVLRDYVLSGVSGNDDENEKFYQGMILSLAAILFSDYVVKSEVNLGRGRCDIQISPKSPGRLGIIIETKILKGNIDNRRLQQSSLNALNQALDMDYVEELRQRQAEPIYVYGMAFNRKNASVSSKIVKK